MSETIWNNQDIFVDTNISHTKVNRIILMYAKIRRKFNRDSLSLRRLVVRLDFVLLPKLQMSDLIFPKRIYTRKATIYICI